MPKMLIVYCRMWIYISSSYIPSHFHLRCQPYCLRSSHRQNRKLPRRNKAIQLLTIVVTKIGNLFKMYSLFIGTDFFICN